MKTGIELISEERQEHFKRHGQTIENDVKFNNLEQLALAASILAIKDIDKMRPTPLDYYPAGWNIGQWGYMVKKSYKERLIIAGALIAAEIDRLNHA